MIDFPDVRFPPTPLVRVQSIAGADFGCGATRVSISPTGSLVAFWTPQIDERVSFGGIGPGTDAQVIDLPCLISGQTNCSGYKLSSRSPFVSLAWTQADYLTAILGGETVAQWNFGANTVELTELQLMVNLAATLEVNGVLPDGQIQNLTTVKTLNRSYRVGPFSWWRGNWFGALMNRETHDLELVNGLSRRDDMVRLSLSAHYVDERAAWSHSTDGSSYLAGGGAFHRLDGQTLTPTFPELINPEAIQDAASGNVIGAFDDEYIQWLQDRPDVLLPDHFYVVDVAVHMPSQTEVVIYRRSDGHNIELSSRKQVRKIQCDDPEMTESFFGLIKSPVRRSWQTKPETSNWGTTDRPLHVRQYRTASESQGQVVVWQGGPGGTFQKNAGWEYVDPWLARGFDVMVVEGSGSAGVELGLRLRREGVSGQEVDARIVARHLASLTPADRTVIVEGTSFGAISAATTASELAEARGSPEKVALVLRDPWLVYRNPEDIEGSRLLPIRSDFARRSEASRFGPMEGLAGYGTQMAQWRANYIWSGPALAIFGRDDLISQPQDLWAGAAEAGGVDVRVLEGRHGVNAAAEAEVDLWLQDRFGLNRPIDIDVGTLPPFTPR